MSEVVIYRGWKDICAPLEVSEDAAQGYAARAFDPLPVFYDHGERPCCRADAMRAWVDRQSLFFHSFHALREAGKLPSQRSKTEHPAHPQRRPKVARRARVRA